MRVEIAEFVIDYPGKMTNTPEKMNTTPGKMINNAGFVIKTPGKMSNNAGFVIKTSGFLIKTPGSMSKTSGKMINFSGKMIKTPGKMIKTSGEMGSVLFLFCQEGPDKNKDPQSNRPAPKEVDEENQKGGSGIPARCDEGGQKIDEEPHKAKYHNDEKRDAGF